MPAGKMRDRVLFQAQSTDTDAAGQPLQTWTDVVTDTADHKVAANVLILGGIEAIKAGAETSVVRASIKIRYRSGITSGMRAVHGDTTYNITAVPPGVGKKEYLLLSAEVVS